MQPTQQKFSIVYVILAFVVLLLMQALLSGPHTENLSHRDFKTLLKADKVEDLGIGERTITGRLKTEGLEGLLPKEKIEELQRFGGASLHHREGRGSGPDLGARGSWDPVPRPGRE
jgi:cell division protease FtsH